MFFGEVRVMTAFFTDESGAITVDYVVLAAAIVGLGVASVGAVRTGTSDLGEGINTSLTSAMVSREPHAVFDFNDVTGLARTSWGWVAFGSYQGWTAAGATRAIEIVESGHRGVHSPDGGNWVDLDASPGNLVLTRGLDRLTNGQTYSLNFNAASSRAANGVDVYFGGEFIRSIEPDSPQFSAFSVDFVAGSGDGSNQIEFRGTGVPDGIGVSLHGIEIR
jgi:Flp pilus assembly pilin Flp